MEKEPNNKILEQMIFDRLGLNEKYREYISIEDDATVRFSFPISIDGLYVGGSPIILDDEAEMDLYDKVIEFYTEKISAGGFRDVHLFRIPRRCRREISFYKEFTTVEEAQDAITWLVEFKKQISI